MRSIGIKVVLIRLSVQIPTLIVDPLSLCGNQLGWACYRFTPSLWVPLLLLRRLLSIDRIGSNGRLCMKDVFLSRHGRSSSRSDLLLVHGGINLLDLKPLVLDVPMSHHLTWALSSRTSGAHFYLLFSGALPWCTSWGGVIAASALGRVWALMMKALSCPSHHHVVALLLTSRGCLLLHQLLLLLLLQELLLLDLGK